MKIGDKLWLVGNRKRHDSHEVTITKIGRSWVYLDNYMRINPETMRVDGGKYTSPAKCYLTREDFEDELEASRVLSIIRNAVGYGKPLCNAAAAHTIARILGINIQKKD